MRDLKLTVLVVLAVWWTSFFAQAETSLSPLEQLGQSLFEDKNLSEPGGQACSSCHEARRAFTGNAASSVPAVARGSTLERLGTRNVPTLMYMAFSPPFSFVAEKNEKGEMEFIPTGGQFWDGRADSLADQVHGPLLNKVEMNNADAATVAAKILHAPYQDPLAPMKF